MRNVTRGAQLNDEAQSDNTTLFHVASQRCGAGLAANDDPRTPPSGTALLSPGMTISCSREPGRWHPQAARQVERRREVARLANSASVTPPTTIFLIDTPPTKQEKTNQKQRQTTTKKVCA